MNFQRNPTFARRVVMVVMAVGAVFAMTSGAAAATGVSGAESFITADTARNIALQICLQRSKYPQACELITQADVPAHPAQPAQPAQPLQPSQPCARVPTALQCQRAYRANCRDSRAYCG